MSSYLSYFEKAKPCPRIYWIQKIMVHCCDVRLCLSIEIFFCGLLLRLARMDMDWILRFNGMPAKNMTKILWFDIFITLPDICVWANALSNDLSIELTWNSDILVTGPLFLNLLIMFWAVIKQRCCSLYWKLPDRAQSFVFCSQIVTESINAKCLLVSKFKMIRMPLNVVHGQVQKS